MLANSKNVSDFSTFKWEKKTFKTLLDMCLIKKGIQDYDTNLGTLFLIQMLDIS